MSVNPNFNSYKSAQGKHSVPKRINSVLVAGAVFLSAKLAVRRRQIVVNAMMHGFQGFQVGKDIG
jgi:hypothetical protein